MVIMIMIIKVCLQVLNKRILCTVKEIYKDITSYGSVFFYVLIDNNCPLCVGYDDYKNSDEKGLFTRSPLRGICFVKEMNRDITI